jgi:uncharacterized protein HemX
LKNIQFLVPKLLFYNYSKLRQHRASPKIAVHQKKRIMSSQKSNTKKGYAVWLILALHISLGLGLYYQHTQTKTTIARVQHASAPAAVAVP